MTDKRDNTMDLWESVRHADTSAIKETNDNGYKHFSINGMAMVEMATKRFGPVGSGWGWEVVEERYDQGAPRFMYDDSGNAHLVHEQMHTMCIKLWYVDGDDRGEVIEYGHTYAQRWSHKNKSMNMDTDPVKKSLTDAVKRALSRLGFFADIYLGKLDNMEYMRDAENQSQIAEAERQEQQAVERREAFERWMRTKLETLKSQETLHTLQLMTNSYCEQASKRAQSAGVNPQAAINRLRKEEREIIEGNAAFKEKLEKKQAKQTNQGQGND